MEQKSKIETYLIYSIFIIIFIFIGYKIHKGREETKVVIDDSRQEIKDIKDSTLNVANQFIEEIKKDKAEKDSTILILKRDKKKTEEKIIKIVNSHSKSDLEINQYKEDVDKIYSDYQKKDSEANKYREKAERLESEYYKKDSEIKDYQEKISNIKKDTVVIVIEKKDTPTTHNKFNLWGKKDVKK